MSLTATGCITQSLCGRQGHQAVMISQSSKGLQAQTAITVGALDCLLCSTQNQLSKAP